MSSNLGMTVSAVPEPTQQVHAHAADERSIRVNWIGQITHQRYLRGMTRRGRMVKFSLNPFLFCGCVASAKSTHY